MATNRKLAEVIAGRRVAGVQQGAGKLVVTCDDGSAMTIKTADPAGAIPVGGTVAKVRQAGLLLSLDMEDGSTVELTTAEETSSVMVRSSSGALEYAD